MFTKFIALTILIFFGISSFAWTFFDISWWYYLSPYDSFRGVAIVLFHVFSIVGSALYLIAAYAEPEAPEYDR